MQVIIKNKFWTIGGSSKIQDTAGNPVANVKGKIFSFTKKKLIQDLEGNTKFIVRNKFWHFFMKSALIYDADKNLICQIKRRVSITTDFKFLKTDKNWRIDGSVFAWNFKLIENEKPIATISRQFNWTDTFLLDTGGQDPFLMMALVIAIDNIVDRELDQAT